jgi:hypothetical protein
MIPKTGGKYSYYWTALGYKHQQSLQRLYSVQLISYILIQNFINCIVT